jgi:predicted SAM-dependent methyltransferase
MNRLNLGCGSNFHSEWRNIDFISHSTSVIQHDLRKGIPYEDDFFDVVYHSHILEHFTKDEALRFIKECYRVLIPGGTIRVAVPDLEAICKEYLNNLNKALNSEHEAALDYDWILLEMFDQVTRNESGGEMAKYLSRKEIPNSEYIFRRIGDEGRNIHSDYLRSIEGNIESTTSSQLKTESRNIRFLGRIKNRIFRALYREEIEELRNNQEALKLGRFKMSGEIHQWMYDRYSLKKLLLTCGFGEVRIVSAFESSIEDWSKYQLDVKADRVRKPDSLFMEATK